MNENRPPEDEQFAQARKALIAQKEIDSRMQRITDAEPEKIEAPTAAAPIKDREEARKALQALRDRDKDFDR